MLARWLDRVLFRRPFERGSAARYERLASPAFGDLHARLAAEILPRLPSRGRLLELGAGPGIFSAICAANGVRAVAIDPSRHFARARTGFDVVRAAGEALPLADATVDIAVCISSIRHVRDRAATLRELRRVTRVTGELVIVELDPRASNRRIATHADQFAESGGHLGRWWLRCTFGPLVVRTAPSVEQIIDVARTAGWQLRAQRDDDVQPVYILDLTR